MKLDTSPMRYLTSEDFRVLQAIELGSRNHELVPTQMIHSIGGLKSPSGTKRAIGDLAKLKLVARLRNAKYDGFRLTHTGYDYLALKTMLNRDTLYSIGSIIGVGKESDIYSVSDGDGELKVMKIHRLGRTSFRTVKNNRDYLRHRQTSNWMYLSRLAAGKEYEFMTVLFENGFSVPEPFDHSRHCIVMEWIKGTTMKNLRQHPNCKRLYSDLMKFVVKLANHGLIHCDFNEFNIIVCEDGYKSKTNEDFVVIDFPQCVSIEHPDAKSYFDRDVESIRSFFAKKFKYSPQHDPTMYDTEGYGEGYKYGYPNFKRDVNRVKNLDVEVKASGYSKKKAHKKEDIELEQVMESMRLDQGYDSDRSEVDSDDAFGSDSDYSEEVQENDLEESEIGSDDNERIIEALSNGTGNLKMDKLGNYILDE